MLGVAVDRLAWDEPVAVAVFMTCSLIDSTLLLKKWTKSRGMMEGGGAGREVLVRFAMVSNRNLGLFLLLAISVE